MRSTILASIATSCHVYIIPGLEQMLALSRQHSQGSRAADGGGTAEKLAGSSAVFHRADRRPFTNSLVPRMFGQASRCTMTDEAPEPRSHPQPRYHRTGVIPGPSMLAKCPPAMIAIGLDMWGLILRSDLDAVCKESTWLEGEITQVRENAASTSMPWRPHQTGHLRRLAPRTSRSPVPASSPSRTCRNPGQA